MIVSNIPNTQHCIGWHPQLCTSLLAVYIIDMLLHRFPRYCRSKRRVFLFSPHKERSSSRQLLQSLNCCGRNNIVVLALASLVYAIPAPQPEDYGILPKAVPLRPAITDLSQPVTYTPTPTIYDTVITILSNGTGSKGAKRRLDDTYAPQPSLSNPPRGSQNVTPADLVADPVLTSTSINASIPYGYTQSFSNLKASLSAPGYLGLYLLEFYGMYSLSPVSFVRYQYFLNPSTCASYCNSILDGACQKFIIFFERDRSLNPAETCANPTAGTDNGVNGFSLSLNVILVLSFEVVYPLGF